MGFIVGDRVKINSTGWEHWATHWPSPTKPSRDGVFCITDEDAGEPDQLGQFRVFDGSDLVGWFDAEHLELAPSEPVSASLSACERVLWASTQEYIRAANTEAETKREGYLSAFRQVVEEDRPELAGKQWTVEDGRFVVQQ